MKARLAVAAMLCATTWLTSASPVQAAESVAARLQRLEDREQILELLTAYGATLDRHDFPAFGLLFAEDAEYGGGPSPTRGRAAIQAQLEKQITSNPMNLPPPNNHLFFNPSIHVDGDRATAHSLGAYVAPDPATKTTRMVFFVSYDDIFVRRNGHWLFQKRVLGSGGTPAPAATK
ncbi:MAG TPA: nuclear transport factor 2 family protein [Steroidobacteraceae bacterium]|nr:nuclear transport factor 2 family protein [Steroidobacteraceae bacterium]